MVADKSYGRQEYVFPTRKRLMVELKRQIDREVAASAAPAPYVWPAVQMRVTFNQDGQLMLTSFPPDADDS